jgi:hypothetical protein
VLERTESPHLKVQGVNSALQHEFELGR